MYYRKPFQRVLWGCKDWHHSRMTDSLTDLITQASSNIIINHTKHTFSFASNWPHFTNGNSNNTETLFIFTNIGHGSMIHMH